MNASVSTYRYGSPRQVQEGLRIGVARYLPRGVRKEDWARRGYFDLWLPLLAPAPEIVKQFQGKDITFAALARHYRAGMKKPEARQVIELLAGISLFLPVSLGCFCENEAHCHRSLLHQLILKAAREKKRDFSALKHVTAEIERYSSPVCFANWEEESGQ